jgi:DNA-directed RNA polymerase specialized sigma24 family protein
MTRHEQIEFLNAIKAMSEKQKMILYNDFTKRIQGTRYSDGMDLLSEAVERVLSGSREWNRKIPIGAFLHEVMRSVLSIDTRGNRERPDVPPVSVALGFGVRG